jgi:hypothetical protein
LIGAALFTLSFIHPKKFITIFYMIAARESFPTFTPEEYFAWEEQQLHRHEYMVKFML